MAHRFLAFVLGDGNIMTSLKTYPFLHIALNFVKGFQGKLRGTVGWVLFRTFDYVWTDEELFRMPANGLAK